MKNTAEARLGSQAGRRLSLFGQVLSCETALHQNAVSLTDQGVASAANFLTGIIIARACSKEGLGLYMLGFSLVLLVMDMQTSLIATPYMMYVPRLKDKARALYTGSALIHELAFCMIALLGVMCGAFAIAKGFGPRALEPVLRTLVFVIALIMLREHARRISFARMKLKTALIFDTCIAVGQISALLVFARFGLLSVSRAFWVIGLVCGIAVVGWLWSDRGFYDPQIGESLADLKKNWLLGKWVFASGLVWTISMNLYPWLLATFHGVASTGVWAACLGVVSVAAPLIVGIQNLMGPKIAHVYAARGHGALHRFMFKMTAVVATLMSFVCLVLFIWGDRLVILLYGRQYAGNGLVIAVLALNALVTAVAFPFSRALFAVDRAKVDFLVNLAALSIIVTLGLWLVQAFGPIGAAFGLLGANVVALAVRAGAFLRLPILVPNGMEAD